MTNPDRSWLETRWLAMERAGNPPRRSAVALRLRGPQVERLALVGETLAELVRDGSKPTIVRRGVTAGADGEREGLQLARKALEGGERDEPTCLIIDIAPDDAFVVLSAPRAALDATSIVSTFAARFADGEGATKAAPRDTDGGSVVDGERAQTFWRAALARPLPVLDFQLDRPRPAKRSFNTAVAELKLGSDLVDGVRAAAKRTNVDPFVVLTAGVSAFLARYTNTDDLFVGVRLSASHVGADGVPAGRSAWVPLRIQVEQAVGFDPLVRTTASAARDMFAASSAITIEEMQRMLGADHGPTLPYDPLSRVVVADVATPVDVYGADLGTSDPELAIVFLRGPRDWTVSIRYSTDVFDAATVQKMLEHYACLQGDLVRAHERPIGMADLMPAEEAARMLQQWAGPQRDWPPATIDSLFRDQVARAPDAIAVRWGDQTVTYAELHERAARVAAFVRGCGAPEGTAIGIYTEPSLEMLAGILGVLEAGRPYLPLDPNYPTDRLKYMVEQSGCALVLSSEEMAKSPPFPASLVSPLSKACAAKADAGAKPTSTPEGTAYVMYTSGSTGKPKGIEVPHRAWVNLARHVIEVLEPLPTDRYIAVTSLSFDMSTIELFLSIVTGGSVILVDRDTAEDGEALRAEIIRQGATVVQTTPSRWRLLVESGLTRADGVRLGISAGEAFPVDLVPTLRASVPSLWNGYGPTETIYCSFFKIERDFERSVPIGKPVANTQFAILNAYDRINPPGVPGDLLVAGHALAHGYLGRPDLTQEKFATRAWGDGAPIRSYRTGDLVRWLPDGNVEYIARVDRQIKLRGFRIEVAEIETILRTHPAIRDCVVTVRRGPSGDDMLVGYVVARFNFSATCVLRAGDVREEMKARDVSLGGMALERIGAESGRAKLSAGDGIALTVVDGDTTHELTGTIAWARADAVAVRWSDDETSRRQAHTLLRSASREGLARPEMTIAGTLTAGAVTVPIRTLDASRSGISLADAPKDVALGTSVVVSLDHDGTRGGIRLTGKALWRSDDVLGIGDLNVEAGETLWDELFDVRRFVSRHLPHYMVPQHTVYLEALPLSPTKKIDINALPAPIIGDDVPARAKGAVEVQLSERERELAQQLAQIWKEELRLPDVPIHGVGFRELGGSSLSLARVVARIRKLPGCEISLRQLGAEVDVATLAKTLANKGETETETAPAVDAAPSLRRPWLMVARLALGLTVCVLAAGLVARAIAPGEMIRQIKTQFVRNEAVLKGTNDVAAADPPVVLWGTSGTLMGTTPIGIENRLRREGQPTPVYELSMLGGTGVQLELLAEELRRKLGTKRVKLSIVELHPSEYGDAVGAFADHTQTLADFTSWKSPLAEEMALRNGFDFWANVMFSRHILNGIPPAYYRLSFEFLTLSNEKEPFIFEGWLRNAATVQKTLGTDFATEWSAKFRGGIPEIEDSPEGRAALAADRELWRWVHEDPAGKVWLANYTLYANAIRSATPLPDAAHGPGGQAYVRFVNVVRSFSDDVVLCVQPWVPHNRVTGKERAALDRYMDLMGEATKASVWNLYSEESFGEEDFLDLDHLAGTGREKLSKLLAERIRERLAHPGK